MLTKNQIITTTILNSGINGEGIAKVDGMTLFIPYALVGEKVVAKVILAKKNFAVARLIEVLTPAEERVRPECRAFTRCGGCQLQHVKYYNQLKIKSANVRDAFRKIAKLDPPVQQCVKSDFIYNYRNKLQLPVGERDGALAIGFYEEYTHNIVPIDECPLHPEWAGKLIGAFKKFMADSGIQAYDEKRRQGTVRHLVARELTGCIMVTLVINDDFLDCSSFAAELKNLFPSFGLYLNINKKDTNVITGDKYLYVCGERKLKDSYNGLRIEVGPGSFLQVNNSVKDKLYYKVLDQVRSEEQPVCIDAYSGTGILSALMAKHANKVYAIEIVEEAIEDAEHIRKINNLSGKLEIIHGDCSEELPPLLERLKGENAILVLDPPRKGCTKAIIKAILKNPPKKIIYISCNPATLARDVGMIMGTLDPDSDAMTPDPLKINGLYEITLVQPYDMFPQTKHVETVVLMSRVEK
ncbi:MAG: 23S rRNA (uracil(1939)-C(5))-methyltransferase RlmD [Clostridiales bacterium]|nr:23S rRNA (uracil(1939)-C(5))-methyltransferase RlmD [Clostridiales bacterium]